jgi:uncharacterized protein (UPF0276 family)
MSPASGASGSTEPLGVGITYCSAIEPLLEHRPALIQVLEIEPQTTWTKSPGDSATYHVNEEVLRHLLTLPGRKLVHSVGTPVGGTVRPEPAQLSLLNACVRLLDSPWVSDHLSFNQTPEFSTGFFLPPRQTLRGVREVVASIGELQAAVPVPVAVETGVNYLRRRPDELPDGEFVARVVQEAGCGLLLDMHNIFTNALNGRQSVREYLDQLPLDRVWEIHLAGGMELDGFWLDAHSGAIPDPLYDIVARLIPELRNLRAIIFEIFPSFVTVVGLDLVQAQIERLHALWERRRDGESRDRVQPSLHQRAEVDGSCPSPGEWERALGALVVGRPAGDPLGNELALDPGIPLMAGLIHEFRASMIVGALRLTSRMLMLALGPEAFRVLLKDYWSRTPPRMYANVEAEAFAEYLQGLDLKLPMLGKILEFEQAATASLVDGATRVVRFDFEPLPLLRALAEGRLPAEPPVPGDYEIEITGDGPSGAGGLDLEALRQAFPFH